MKTRSLAAIALLTVAACTPKTTAAHTPRTAPPVAGSVPAPGSCHMRPGGLPDAACTPGATNPAVTQTNIAATICVTGWTATIRPPVSYTNALKTRQMAAYGDTGAASGFEEDHFIPLEIGGAPTNPANLWPEPRTAADGASAKDAVEDAGHRAVCAKRITLAAAQHGIATDWAAFGKQLAATP